jgi:hypothetical protein
MNATVTRTLCFSEIVRQESLSPRAGTKSGELGQADCMGGTFVPFCSMIASVALPLYFSTSAKRGAIQLYGRVGAKIPIKKKNIHV